MTKRNHPKHPSHRRHARPVGVPQRLPTGRAPGSHVSQAERGGGGGGARWVVGWEDIDLYIQPAFVKQKGDRGRRPGSGCIVSEYMLLLSKHELSSIVREHPELGRAWTCQNLGHTDRAQILDEPIPVPTGAKRDGDPWSVDVGGL